MNKPDKLDNLFAEIHRLLDEVHLRLEARIDGERAIRQLVARLEREKDATKNDGTKNG